MSSTESKRIFIVDDDEMLTMALTDYLTREVEHDIHVFHSGEDCLNSSVSEPDFVVLDFYLDSSSKEGLTGLDVLKKIRGKLPSSKIVMLSSQNNFAIAAELIEEGVDQYIIKDESSFDKIKELISQ